MRIGRRSTCKSSGRPTWAPEGLIAITTLQPYSSRFREGTNQLLLISTTGAPARRPDGSGSSLSVIDLAAPTLGVTRTINLGEYSRPHGAVFVANGGKLVRPHLVQNVQVGGGSAHSPPRIVHTFTPPAPQQVGLDPTALAVVQDGLYQATHSPLGTSYGVFGQFPITIAGKTGTAEKIIQLPQFHYLGSQDQSWWCGYGPAGAGENPELVVCALIENGGHGGDAAAPAALKVFESYFHRSVASLGTVHSD